MNRPDMMVVMMTMRCQEELAFTKESAACSAFPHQVHGPGQGARAGECPRVHASILGAEATTAAAQFPIPRRKKKEGIKRKKSNNKKRRIGGNRKDREGKGRSYVLSLFVSSKSKIVSQQEHLNARQTTHSAKRSSSVSSPSPNAFIPLILLLITPPPSISPYILVKNRKKERE